MEVILSISVSGFERSEKARAVARQLDIPVSDRRIGDEGWEKASRILSMLHLTLSKEQGLRLVQELRRSGIEPRITYDAQYTRGEIFRARLVGVATLVDRPNADADLDARYQGATGGCKRCKSLARLRGPFMFRDAPQPDSSIVGTSTGEWLVSQRLSQILRGLPGVAKYLAPLNDAGRWTGWERLVVEPTLPPIHPSSTGHVFDNQCPVCKRDGFYGDNSQAPPVLRYGEGDLGEIEPINGTYELTGNSRVEDGRILSLAMPLLIVTPDVAGILLDETIGDVRLDPVELV